MNSGLIKRLAHPIFIIALLVAIVVMMLLFRLRSETLQAWATCSGQSTCSSLTLDALFGYSPDFAYKQIEMLGNAGRQVYALTELTLDVAFPVSYSLFLAILLWLLLNPHQGKSWRWWITRVPLLGGFMDLCENSLITAMLWRYPQQYPMMASLASLAGILKWIMGAISLAVIVILALKSLLQRALQKLDEEKTKP